MFTGAGALKGANMVFSIEYNLKAYVRYCMAPTVCVMFLTVSRFFAFIIVGSIILTIKTLIVEQYNQGLRYLPLCLHLVDTSSDSKTTLSN